VTRHPPEADPLPTPAGCLVPESPPRPPRRRLSGRGVPWCERRWGKTEPTLSAPGGFRRLCWGVWVGSIQTGGMNSGRLSRPVRTAQCPWWMSRWWCPQSRTPLSSLVWPFLAHQPLDVVTGAPARWPVAAGEGAAAIAQLQGAAERPVEEADPPAQVQRLTGRAHDGRDDAGVAGQRPGRPGADRLTAGPQGGAKSSTHVGRIKRANGRLLRVTM